MSAFVKFSRGLISTYNNLISKDPNTLYLVYETKESKNGSLYLGDKLISQVASGNINISLNDLTNVTIGDNLEDGMLLQYNSSTNGGVWEAVPLSNIINGQNNISIINSFSEIDIAKDKDIAILGSNAYIYYNNKWNRLTDSELIERVSSLEEKIGEKSSDTTAATGLYKEIDDLKSNVYTKEEIDSFKHLRYQIVNSVEDIDIESSPNNIIYLVPNITDDNNNYDEYSIINGQLEKIGSHAIDLTNYVTKDDNSLLTEVQRNKINSLGLDENNKATINAAQVIDLNQIINENQIIKSVSPSSFEITPEGELQLKATPSIDLSNYVQTSVFNAVVGDLDELSFRVDENSTLVQEINSIKESIIWQELKI